MMKAGQVPLSKRSLKHRNVELVSNEGEKAQSITDRRKDLCKGPSGKEGAQETGRLSGWAMVLTTQDEGGRRQEPECAEEHNSVKGLWAPS